MRKFIVIQDIRAYPSYANVNARLLYLHVACQVDISTYTCAKSLRQLARELSMTLGEVRHALQQLVADGLITTHTATHTAAHLTTHLTTQLTTHLTIVRINENGAPNGAPNDTPNNTPNDTPNDTQNKKNNNNNNKLSPLTDARVNWSRMAGILEETLSLQHADAAAMVDAFRQRQRLKNKAWSDEGDLSAHLVSWAEKRLSSVKNGAQGAKVTDHDARVQEHTRTREEAAKRTQEEKEAEEVQRIMRWLADARKKKETERIKILTDELKKRKAI